MRSSDWSSDVCSSDLELLQRRHVRGCGHAVAMEGVRVLADAVRVVALGVEGDEQHARAGRFWQRFPLLLRLRQFGQRGRADVGAVGETQEHQGPVALEFTGHQLGRSEEHTSELQSLMRISYAVFCLKTT